MPNLEIADTKSEGRELDFDYIALGTDYLKEGEAKKALAVGTDLLMVPEFQFDAWKLIGLSFLELNAVDQAIEALKKAIKLSPNDVDLLITLGKAFRGGKQIPASLTIFRKAIELDESNLVAMKEMHESILALGRLPTKELLEEIKRCTSFYEASIIGDPTRIDLYYSLSHLYIMQGRSEDSVKLIGALREILPECNVARYNHAMALKDAGLVTDAIELLESIRVPNNLDLTAKVNHSLGHAYLQKFDFAKGWDLYESRWQDEHFPSKNLDVINDKLPRWGGQQVGSLLVWTEQGIGDEIMFSSVLEDAGNLCGLVTVACDGRLIQILERSFSDNIKFVDKKPMTITGKFDAQIPIGSLPMLFRRNFESFARCKDGYLRPNNVTVKKIRENISCPKNFKLVGLSWFSNSTTHARLIRNASLVDMLKKIGTENRYFVCLQYGDVESDIMEAKRCLGIQVINPKDIDQRADLDNLANLISACDHVVSVDNVTVHLAGALGVPTTAFIPSVPDWRWGFKDPETYWYSSVRLHRQVRPSFWPALAL
ncbi:tetratricopeptide repeat protein [Luminiphilus sp.]|nr:tetratricopeptide repeat protein [Luminiphilus sp.]